MDRYRIHLELCEGVTEEQAKELLARFTGSYDPHARCDVVSGRIETIRVWDGPNRVPWTAEEDDLLLCASREGKQGHALENLLPNRTWAAMHLRLYSLKTRGRS